MKRSDLKPDGYKHLLFHSFTEEGHWCWNGYVAHVLPDGRLICTVFDAFLGAESDQYTVHVSDTKDWLFFTDYDLWSAKGAELGRAYVEGRK